MKLMFSSSGILATLTVWLTFLSNSFSTTTLLCCFLKLYIFFSLKDKSFLFNFKGVMFAEWYSLRLFDLTERENLPENWALICCISCDSNFRLAQTLVYMCLSNHKNSTRLVND